MGLNISKFCNEKYNTSVCDNYCIIVKLTLSFEKRSENGFQFYQKELRVLERENTIKCVF